MYNVKPSSELSINIPIESTIIDGDGITFNHHVNSLDSSSMLSPSSKPCSDMSIFIGVKDMKSIKHVFSFDSKSPKMEKVAIHGHILGVKEMNDRISKMGQECLGQFFLLVITH